MTFWDWNFSLSILPWGPCKLLHVLIICPFILNSITQCLCTSLFNHSSVAENFNCFQFGNNSITNKAAMNVWIQIFVIKKKINHISELRLERQINCPEHWIGFQTQMLLLYLLCCFNDSILTGNYSADSTEK